MLASHTSSIGELIEGFTRLWLQGLISFFTPTSPATPLSTQFGSSEIIFLGSLSLDKAVCCFILAQAPYLILDRQQLADCFEYHCPKQHCGALIARYCTL